jgi:hypothetical protein
VRRKFSLVLVFVAAAVVAAHAAELKVTPSAQSVPRFAKIEFDLNAPANYRDPFDPSIIDLALEVTGPDHKRVTIPAFVFQPYERRGPTNGLQRDWCYPTGALAWKARFAPLTTGVYRARAILKDRDGERRSSEISFESIASTNKGFIRVGRKDPRFFEFDNGAAFFAIGQNLAFIGSQQYVTLTRAEQIFGKLADNGVNYLRVWTGADDWALAIEARKSAWGRSWSGKGTFQPLPEERSQNSLLLDSRKPMREVNPSHPVALRPDTDYVFVVRGLSSNAAVRAEVHGSRSVARLPSANGAFELRSHFKTGPKDFWLGATRLFVEGQSPAWISDVSLQEAGGGPELLWEADMNRPERGYYNPLDCFLLDQVLKAAERHGIHLQLCMLTRDLYMSALQDASSTNYARAIADAKKFFRHAIARWGYSTSVASWEYWNEMNPGLPTDRFYEELGKFFEESDPYRHLRSTSTWGPSPKDARHSKLDFADVHFYLRPADKARLGTEVDAVLDRARWLREHAPAKPVLLGEFGLADDKWRITDDLKSIPDLSDLHNALWAAALSGMSGTGLAWWWERIDQRNGYPLYGPISRFVRDIPWNSGRIRTLEATNTDPATRVVGLRADDRGWLWVFDTAAAWEKVAVQKQPAPERSGLVVDVSGFSGTRNVRWIDTRTEIVVREEKVGTAGDRLSLQVPSFRRDIACQIE